jgi:uncharacterized protein involved in cysteine biosynthesis
MGFIRGLWAPFRGAAFVAHHRLWLYVIAPILLNLALIAGTTWLAMRIVRERLAPGVLGSSALAAVGLWVVAVVVGLIFFVILQPVVGAPFVDALTEKAETVVRGGHPRVGLLLSAWHATWHGLLKLLIYLLALAIVLALTSLTGPVGGAISAALSALLLAYDGFDYPLARRGARFRAKWKYLLVHPGQTLGYCVGATLLYLVPLAIVVAPAFAAVGATLAFLDTHIDTDPGALGRASMPPANGGPSSQ